MLTVETDPVAVEQRLGSGRLACPGCSGVLAGWGHARGRQVRDTDAVLWIVPRRARCTGCRATHVLLPVVLLVRRADTAAVIGAGLTAKATGAGHRLIAALLGRPRGDGARLAAALRRTGSRRSVRCSPRWCRDLAPDPVLPGPAGSAWADAIAAVLAVAAAVGARFSIGEVPVWQAASAVSGARLLLPGWPVPADRG